MKKILILLAALVSLNVTAQKILSKQQNGYGSCSYIHDAIINFKANNITLYVNVYKDNEAFLSGEQRTYLYTINIPMLVNPADTFISYLLANDDRYTGAAIINVSNIASSKDTLWVDIPARQSDTSIHRKVGVYSMPIDFETKTCNIKAVAKHVQNNILILSEQVQWTVERSDSFYYSGSKLSLFDFMNDLMKAGDYSREKRLEVLGYGLNIFYPNNINDRITD